MRRACDRRLRGLWRIRVHEVQVRVVGDAVPQRRRRRLLQAAPADDRKVRAAFDPDDAAGEQTEALVPPALGGLVEQQLVPKAYPEHGLAAPREAGHPPPEPVLGELGHGGRERAHAWQHQALRPLELIGIGRDQRLGAGMHQRALHGAQVADAVVDDGYQPSRPFEDGTAGPPPARVASRRARPSALNVASATWCRLRPRMRSTWMVAPRWMDMAFQNSSSTSDSSVPMRPRSGTLYDMKGRLPRSTTTRASASSSGA